MTGGAGAAAGGVGFGGGAGAETSKLDRPLLFSEYVEGSSTNKALEIAALATSSLDDCDVLVFSNGALETTEQGTVVLAGALELGQTYVLCSPPVADTLGGICAGALGTSRSQFSGNDAIVLECGGVVLDVIGQIGVDPGSAWSAGGVSTRDQTLRRRCAVAHGDTDGTNPFDPSLEWESFAKDDFSGLGSYGCSASP
jgi:hypothetical protein